MNHTPGPWSRTGLLVASTQYKEPGSDKINLEIASVGGRNDKEALANARLITTAPEMKDELTYLVRRLKAYNADPYEEEMLDWRDAEALLRRIDGEEEAE